MRVKMLPQLAQRHDLSEGEGVREQTPLGAELPHKLAKLIFVISTISVISVKIKYVKHVAAYRETTIITLLKSSHHFKCSQNNFQKKNKTGNHNEIP